MVEVTVEHLEGGAWVPQTIKLDVDVDMSLTDEGLDQEMCAIPSLMSKYGQLSAELQAGMLRKKNNVEVAEAELAQAIRISHAASGEKLTEPGIKEQINQSPNIESLRHEAYDAERQYRMLMGFYTSLKEKSSLSIALCYKQKEEIRVMSSPLI